MENDKNNWGYIVKVGMVVGIVLLLTLGILLPIKFVPAALSTFSRSIKAIFSRTEAPELTADKTNIRSGEPFTLYWKGVATDEKGSFSLTYECKEGFIFEHAIGAGNERIGCEAPFYFSAPSTNSLTLTPILERQRFIDVSVRVRFEEENAGEPRLLGQVTISVTNENFAGTATTTPNNSGPIVGNTGNQPATTTPAGGSPTPGKTGTPDLSIRLISTGILGQDATQFTPTTSFNSNSRAAIRFEIANTGDGPSGTWRFSALLPAINTNQTSYLSQPQTSLRSGDRIEYTLGFDGLKNSGNNPVTVYVDPTNTVREKNEVNNLLSINIVNSGTGNNTGGNGTGFPGGTSQGTDLAVELIGIGKVDYQNQFYLSPSIYQGDRAAIKFKVINRGINSSSTWGYTVRVPGQPVHTYNSGNLESLTQNNYREFTVIFDSVSRQGQSQYTQNVTIEIDPENRTNDSNRGNNTVQSSFVIY